MAVFELSVSASSASDFAADVLVLGATANGGVPQLLASAGFESLSESLKAIGATGAVDQLIRIPGASPATSIAIIGVGAEVTPDALRIAAGSAVRQLAGTRSVALALPVADDSAVEAVLEGAALGAYSFTAYKGTSLESQKAPVAAITVLTDATTADSAATAAAITRARAIASAGSAHACPRSG